MIQAFSQQKLHYYGISDAPRFAYHFSAEAPLENNPDGDLLEIPACNFENSCL